MSKNKSKITKWEYVTEPFDVLVLPELVKRVHSPLTPWLSSLTENCYVHLRPCVQGLDEDGAVVKYLYCTRYGRFFVRGKDGWNEILPHGRSENFKKKGSGYNDAPQLKNFGNKLAHRCVAFAWLDVPKDVKLQMIGVDAPTKWEVDHLNTDHKNWTADNLQWVTPDENRRRGKIARQLRKAAIDPKILTPTLCRGIYTLPEERIGEFIGRFLMACNECGDPMDIWSIRMCVAIALDAMKK